MSGLDRWKGKTALVTGSSGGIGYAIAVALLEAGINVVGCARNPAPLEKLKGELPPNSGKLTAFKSDLTKEDEIQDLFREIEARIGHVDILVNNAGTALLGNLVDGDPASWKTMFELNVHATTVCSKEVLRLLGKDGIHEGHIININSIVGHQISPVNVGMYYYSATKHMITALTKQLYAELSQKKSKVRVTSLSPGLVNTPLVEGVKNDAESGKYFRERAALEPKDIANAVLYVLGTPPSVLVTELTILPATQ